MSIYEVLFGWFIYEQFFNYDEEDDDEEN